MSAEAGDSDRPGRAPRRRVVLAFAAGTGFAFSDAIGQGLRRALAQRRRRSRPTIGRRCVAVRRRSSSATARR
jgi:hypothetical protein